MVHCNVECHDKNLFPLWLCINNKDWVDINYSIGLKYLTGNEGEGNRSFWSCAQPQPLPLPYRTTLLCFCSCWACAYSSRYVRLFWRIMDSEIVGFCSGCFSLFQCFPLDYGERHAWPSSTRSGKFEANDGLALRGPASWTLEVHWKALFLWLGGINWQTLKTSMDKEDTSRSEKLTVKPLTDSSDYSFWRCNARAYLTRYDPLLLGLKESSLSKRNANVPK